MEDESDISPRSEFPLLRLGECLNSAQMGGAGICHTHFTVASLRPEVAFNLAQGNRRAKFQSTSWEEVAEKLVTRQQ